MAFIRKKKTKTKAKTKIQGYADAKKTKGNAMHVNFQSPMQMQCTM